jgi:hypothetical protein
MSGHGEKDERGERVAHRRPGMLEPNHRIQPMRPLVGELGLAA